MDTKEISLLIERILKSMSGFQLSESTVLSYKSAFTPIRKYHKKFGMSEYSDRLTAEFIVMQKERLRAGSISARHFRKLQRATNLLHEFNETGNITWRVYTEAKLPNSQYLRQIYVSFVSSLRISIADGTIKNIKSILTDFLLYLEENGHKDFQGVHLTDIRYYLVKIAGKNPRSMGNIIFALRKFWNHLNETGIVNLDAGRALTRPAGPFKKVLPCFSKEEARILLNQAKNGSTRGYRDYAILLLALHTGLRSIDIVHLKLADIDWCKKEINIVQRKTDNALTLPLNNVTGNAIADYILNYRPNSDSQYVFLRTFAPFDRLSDQGTGVNIIRPYLKALNREQDTNEGKTTNSGRKPVSGRGFHALRRSMGTWLIESGSDISTAAQVLGHRDHNSTKQYISFHYSGLRHCCMGLSGIETVREGLI